MLTDYEEGEDWGMRGENLGTDLMENGLEVKTMGREQGKKYL
jgi:hypothetical protein